MNNKQSFYEAIILGREIEFIHNNIKYFESYDENGWYIDNLHDDSRQYFDSCDELMIFARLNGVIIEECWDGMEIEYIL